MVKTTRALIVDDSRPIRGYLRHILREASVEVAGEAGDGEEAVAAYKILRPDLVFLDINMPSMDGITALKAIRAADPGARVIMLTSVNWSESVIECIEAGAESYLPKDLPREALVQELTALLCSP